MGVFLIGILLIVGGLLIASAGYPLFRIMLPLMGFFAGFGLGYSMIQATTGSGVFSFLAAVLTALVLGLVLAVLSYMYYALGVLLITASFMAGIFAYFGQVIGLRNEGFIVGLLSLTGSIVGVMVFLRYRIQHAFIVVLTSMFGVGLIFAGAFLMVGNLSLNDIYANGLARSISTVVSSSWIWLIAWIGGTVLAAQSQFIMVARAVFGDQFALETSKKK